MVSIVALGDADLDEPFFPGPAAASLTVKGRNLAHLSMFFSLLSLALTCSDSGCLRNMSLFRVYIKVLVTCEIVGKGPTHDIQPLLSQLMRLRPAAENRDESQSP